MKMQKIDRSPVIHQIIGTLLIFQCFIFAVLSTANLSWIILFVADLYCCLFHFRYAHTLKQNPYRNTADDKMRFEEKHSKTSVKEQPAGVSALTDSQRPEEITALSASISCEAKPLGVNRELKTTDTANTLQGEPDTGPYDLKREGRIHRETKTDVSEKSEMPDFSDIRAFFNDD